MQSEHGRISISAETKGGWNKQLEEQGVEKKEWLACYNDLAHKALEGKSKEVKKAVCKEREEAKCKRANVLETEKSMMQSKPANCYQNKERAT